MMKKILLTLTVLLGFCSARAATYTLTPDPGSLTENDEATFLSGTWSDSGTDFDVQIYKLFSTSTVAQVKQYRTPLRWYAGYRLVVSAPEGELITDVGIILGASGSGTTFESFCGGEITPAASTAANSVIKWTDSEGVAAFDAIAPKQTRVASLKITTKPADGERPAPLMTGNGTKENPFTCSDVRIIKENYTGTVLSTYTHWVKGYIVGVTKSASAGGILIGETSSTLALALGPKADETDPEKCIAVGLSTTATVPGTDTKLNVVLNLQNNPENMGKEIMLYGGLNGYLSQPGMTSLKEFEWVDNENPTPSYKRVKSVKEILALEEGSLIETTCELTVAFVNYNNVFVCDDYGDFIQIYNQNTLETENVIPAGLKATYTKYSGTTPELIDATIPSPKGKTIFFPATVAPANITNDLVNNVIAVKNVKFAEATPATKANFTGTADGVELNFYNGYGLESVGAGLYNVEVVVNIYQNKPSLYVISYEKLTSEVADIKEILALDVNTSLSTTFPVTVAYVNGSNAYACDADGNFILITGATNLAAGDVIPAGLTGTYTLDGGVPAIAADVIPATTQGSFTPATEDAANITVDMVNHVFTVNNVRFAQATPSDAQNFNGTSEGTTLTFSNNFAVESVPAGLYNVTVAVSVLDNSPLLYVIAYEEVMNEAGSINEILALDANSLITTTFPLTVAFAMDNDAYVCDEEGNYILITGAGSLNAGDVIPAGLVGKYALDGEVPAIAADVVPAATEGTYTPAVEDPENITTDMVNHVFVINDVRFTEDTPSGLEDFSGTAADIDFAFRNKYYVEGVPSGLYNVTVAVSILDNAPLLYVISYQEAPGNIRNAGDIAAFIGNCTEESFPNVAINNPVVALYQNGNNLYIKDDSGYLLVYGDVKQTYTNGMIIPGGITGSAQNYRGVYEMSSPDASTFAAGEQGKKIAPEVITYDMVASTPVNTFVQMKGLVFTQDLEGIWTLVCGREVVPMYNKFNLSFVDGGVATVEGFIGIYNGDIVFMPTDVNIETNIPTPTFSVKSGAVVAGTTVAIECADPDAAIYYNFDGSNTYFKRYTEPIEINEAMTIKAIAVSHGMQSLVGRASYTIEGSDSFADIDADNEAPVEYYNLQGIRVANPESGLYIRRQGNKVSKVIF